MRAYSALSVILVAGIVLYAAHNMKSVGDALRIDAPAPPREPKSLAEAAPEVAGLRDHFRILATRAKKVIPLCPSRRVENDLPRPRGKVLIWDLTMDDVSEAHGRLPAGLRARDANEPMTVFLITQHVRQELMEYFFDFWHGGGNTGVRGFRIDLKVSVVDLPSRQPRGSYLVLGKGPPTTIQLKPGQKEVEEDWAGNLGRWVESCVHGPEPRHYKGLQASEARWADQSRAVLAKCEARGSARLPQGLPKKVLIWNPQCDTRHRAQNVLASDLHPDATAENVLVAMVMDEQFVRIPNRPLGRFDFTVALVAFPGAHPIGVYTVKGDEWPLPRSGQSWIDRDPTAAVGQWVSQICRRQQRFKERVVPVEPFEVQLAASDWLKGPGWLARPKSETLPADQQPWLAMAEQASAAIEQCRQKSSSGVFPRLPERALIWNNYAEMFRPSPAQQKLSKDRQATKQDTEALVVFVLDSKHVQKRQYERVDHTVALVAMPGARPVGTFLIRGQKYPQDRAVRGKAKRPDSGQEIADWVSRFLDSPEQSAHVSALHDVTF
jgi:hypothetical protein